VDFRVSGIGCLLPLSTEMRDRALPSLATSISEAPMLPDWARDQPPGRRVECGPIITVSSYTTGWAVRRLPSRTWPTRAYDYWLDGQIKS
jgi:hypothetical protein